MFYSNNVTENGYFAARRKKAGAAAKTGCAMTKRGRLALVLALGLMLAALCGCAAQKKTEEFFSMDTVMQLTVYGRGAAGAIEAAEDAIYGLDAKLSAQNEASELAALNRGGQCRDEQTLAILARALEIAAQTDGAYDPSVYPLMKLWGFGTEQAHVPQREEISAALEKTGYEKLPAVSASYALPAGMAVDFGGIGKGAAGAQARAVLQACGVRSAVLSLGGNVTLLGSKPDGTDWTIGLQSPSGAGCFGYVRASDVSVVTSGGYQRYFEENGRRYWHILNPETGYPAETGLASVTIVSRDDVLADGLSTALFVMGLDRAAEHWRGRGDYEAVFLLESGEIFVTQGLAERFESEQSFEVIRR